MTLADEDTSSTQIDDANRAMWQCKWRHFVAKFRTNANCATWLQKSDPMPVAPSGSEFKTSVASRLASLFLKIKLFGVLKSKRFFPSIDIVSEEVIPLGGRHMQSARHSLPLPAPLLQDPTPKSLALTCLVIDAFSMEALLRLV